MSVRRVPPRSSTPQQQSTAPMLSQNTRAVATAPTHSAPSYSSPRDSQQLSQQQSQSQHIQQQQQQLQQLQQQSDHSKMYENIKALGRGAFGEVFLVREKATQKLFVIKKVNLEILKPKEQELAEAEVHILSSLRHPNIVAHKESFLDRENNLCMVLQYCDGGDLAQAINKAKHADQTFNEEQVVDWICQLVSALSYIHAHHIVHRDLKTSNIFLTKKNVIKLGDFGISKILDNTTDLAMTMVGTPYYMSPEVCQNQPYNHKSDVWAMGCCIYEVCTLQRAFGADSLMGLVYKIVKEQYPPIPTTYSQQLRDLIGSMMAKNPRDRPSTEQIFQLPFVKQRMRDFLLETQFLDPKTASNPEPQQKAQQGHPALTPSAREKVMRDRQMRKETLPNPSQRVTHQQTPPSTAPARQQQIEPKKQNPRPAPINAGRQPAQARRNYSDSEDSLDDDDSEEYYEDDFEAYEDDFESESDDEELIVAVRKDYQRNLQQAPAVTPKRQSQVPTPSSTNAKAENRRVVKDDEQVVQVTSSDPAVMNVRIQKMRSESERYFGRDRYHRLYQLFMNREKMSDVEFKRIWSDLVGRDDQRYAMMVEEIAYRDSNAF